MFVLAAALALGTSFASPPPDRVAEFRARDQALLDAITSGDRSVWNSALGPDAIFVDENGKILTRADMLAQIVPLPPEISGNIAISDYTLQLSDGLALVIHKDAETEVWHGQSLKADYITTETWQREAGAWKLLLAHAYVVAKDPPAISMPASSLEDYVGRYQAGPGVIAAVRRDGDHLTFQDRKKPAQPFLVEAQDVLFIPGEPRFRDFVQRDGKGHVTGFIERREGEDVHWTRLP